MFDKILTPLDGTPDAQAGLAWAVEAASRCGASIELLTILDPADEAQNGTVSAAHAYLNTERDRVGSIAPSLKVDTEVAVGPLAEELVARASEAPLTVMTYTTSHWLQGGALALLLKEMINPVVITRSHDGRTSPVGCSRILAPISTTAGSFGALHVAGELATVFSADVTLCEVVTPPLGAFSKRFPTKDLAEIMDYDTEVAQQALSAAGKEIVEQGVTVDSVVRVGDPAREILRAAKETDAGLIAMATRGSDSMSRMMGSVALGVMQSSPVPCMLVRPAPAPFAA